MGSMGSNVHDVGPYTRVGWWIMKITCGRVQFLSTLVWLGWKRRLYWLSVMIVQSSEASQSYIWKMTIWFEIEGLVARQVRCHFTTVCHITLDTRPHIFFLQVKNAERGLGTRLALSYGEGVVSISCTIADIHKIHSWIGVPGLNLAEQSPT